MKTRCFVPFAPGVVLALLLWTAVVTVQATAPVYWWTTLAGRASTGSDDGAVAQARFQAPTGLAVDPSGNIYVADTGNHTVRRISTAGVVTTVAGTAGLAGYSDGAGVDARFNAPQGVAVDASGNVYVADTGNHVIRQITATGVVTTLAGLAGTAGTVDGNATTARFSSPALIAADRSGTVYVLDHGIRKIVGGAVQTLYAGGIYNYASKDMTVGRFSGLAVGPDGRVYFSAYFGTATVASRQYWGVFVLDPTGAPALVLSNDEYPWYSHVQTDQYYARATITSFGRIAVSQSGDIAVAAQRFLGYAPWSIERFRADGTWLSGAPVSLGGQARIGTSGIYAGAIPGIAFDPAGDVLLTKATSSGDMGQNEHVVSRLSPDGTFTVLAGTPWSTHGTDGTGSKARFSVLGSLYVDDHDNAWVSDTWSYQGDTTVQIDVATALRKVSPSGVVTTPIDAPWSQDMSWRPWGVAGEANGVVYLGKRSGATYALQTLPADLNVPVTTYIPIVYHAPDNFVTDSSGNLVVADGTNHLLRKLTPGGAWSILAGAEQQAGTADGIGPAARFGDFSTVTKDRAGNYYVLDSSSSPTNPTPGKNDVTVIRKITPAGAVSTISQNLVRNGRAPSRLAMGSDGGAYLLYGNSVWHLDAQGTLTLLGGDESREGTADGIGAAALFSGPSDLQVDADGNLYLVDGHGTTVRFGGYAGNPPAITSQPASQTVTAGQSAQFSVQATGVPAPTYQWYFQGQALAGATDASLKIGQAQMSDAGTYSVTVTNLLGSVQSSSATLTVSSATPAPAPGPGPSSGGGGAPSLWLLGALAGMGLLRLRRLSR